MTYNLPKPYLSYSAFSLWQKDKDAFRRRYYENEKPFETVETIFGKTVHEKLESDGEVIGSETKIEINFIEGLKLLGYIDSFNEEDLAIIDFKTGHLDSKGNAPWDRVKVQKHKQLVFYTLIVQAKFGSFNPIVKLEWLETKFKNKSMDFNGHVLNTESRELELTGYKKIFERRVFKWEIKKLKQEIKKVARDISNDYTLWLKSKEDSPSAKSNS